MVSEIQACMLCGTILHVLDKNGKEIKFYHYLLGTNFEDLPYEGRKRVHRGIFDGCKNVECIEKIKGEYTHEK